VKAIDVFKRPVKVGDYVAAATSSYKATNLRVGKVYSVSEAGNISIHLPGRKYVNTSTVPGVFIGKYVDSIVSVTIHSGRYIIITPDSLPEDFRNQLD